MKLVHPQTNVTLVHSRNKLMSSESLPDDCKDRALELLREAGVEVLLDHRAVATASPTPVGGVKKHEKVLEFTNGTKIMASEILYAISNGRPSTAYLPQSALDDGGYVKVEPW